MRVNVDGEVGVLGTDGTDEAEINRVSKIRNLMNNRNSHLSSLGLEQTSHILEAKNVDTLLDELLDEVEVVLESVLGLVGARDITAIAHGGLDDTTGLLGGIDTELHLREKSVTYSERTEWHNVRSLQRYVNAQYQVEYDRRLPM